MVNRTLTCIKKIKTHMLEKDICLEEFYMNKIKRMAIAFFSLFFLATNITGTEVFATEDVTSGQYIILIDPGHGGIDGGAVSKTGTLEKDINLQISLKLKEKLQNQKYKIFMTREADEGLYDKGRTVREKKVQDLNKRVKMKEETGCNIFISIHQNMFPQAKYKGSQVWYASNEDSKLLAEITQESLQTNVDQTNKRQCKPAGNMYKILRNDDKCSSIIVECGFMSNYEEEQLLKNDAYQQKIVDAIVKAVDKYAETKNLKKN